MPYFLYNITALQSVVNVQTWIPLCEGKLKFFILTCENLNIANAGALLSE